MPSQTGSKDKGRFYIENVSKNFIVPYNDFKIEKETSRLIDLLTVKTGRNDRLDIGDEIAVFDNGANEKKRFGGFISNVEETQSAYKIEVQEFTVEIVDTKVKRVFRDVSPEQILDKLITENTDLTFKAPVSSGFTIDKYVIEGKIQEAVKDMVDLLNWQARSTPQKEFYLEPRGRIESGVTFTHAQNCVVTKKKTKDSKFINTVELRAGRTNYHQTNTFSGDGSKKEFSLSEVPVGGVEVFVGGTRKDGGISEDLRDGDDFFIDQDGPSLIFDSAPASGTDNIDIEYNYEVPILVEATTDDAKIPASEREISETITRKFLKTFSDAKEYAQSYVDNKSSLIGNVEFFADFREQPRTGHLVTVEDSSKNISDDFVVEKKVLKSNGQMTVTVGDEQFNAIEWRNSVQRKIKELEKDKTTNKTLTKFLADGSDLDVSFSTSFTIKKREINDSFILSNPTNGQLAASSGSGGTQAVIDRFNDLSKWNGSADGTVVQKSQVKVQGSNAQKWRVDASKSTSDKAVFTADQTINIDLSTALGTSSGPFTKGAFGWHIRIDDTSVLKGTDAIKLKIGSGQNDYAVWTLDRDELGENEKYGYLVFSNNDVDSIVGSPNWSNTDFFELTVNESSGNTTDTFIYVDYLTVSDRQDIGATGLGDRRSALKEVRTGG